jgi:hypothetical protein
MNNYTYPTMRCELDEGPALVYLPEKMSKQSLAEFEEAMEIQLRRYHRHAAAETAPAPEPT